MTIKNEKTTMYTDSNPVYDMTSSTDIILFEATDIEESTYNMMGPTTVVYYIILFFLI